MNSSFPKPAPRTGILQRNYGFVHFATLDEPIFIREKTVHYSGSLKRGKRCWGSINRGVTETSTFCSYKPHFFYQIGARLVFLIRAENRGRRGQTLQFEEAIRDNVRVGENNSQRYIATISFNTWRSFPGCFYGTACTLF
jgi:hypothetical protein